ncbi:MAG: AmmeMemoRadiSam system protein B [Candidatus Latescibacterota bacterium]|jgi:hypothetical protein
MSRLAGAAALSLLVCCAAAPPDAGVRSPAVAGRFYPEDPDKLRAAVQGFLDQALPPRGERPIALVVPHAGYVYSAQIAADGYRQAADFPPEVVVLLGTNHTVPEFAGMALYQGEGFRTPLGVAPIDGEVTRALLAADPMMTARTEPHAEEHSVEVQVPFIQVAFPRACIVAAVVGTANPAVAGRLGQVLARVLQGRRALIVASSDLTHYPAYEDAVEVDRRVLTAVAGMDPAEVVGIIAREMKAGRPGLSTCACGEGPILVALVAARSLGAGHGIVVSYANSGDTVPGDRSRVVGYGAVALTEGSGGPDLAALVIPTATAPATLPEADRRYLLALARRTITDYLELGMVPLPRAGSPALRQHRGAFVTLQQQGQLRGCIGHMAEDTPLALTVARMALQAAFHDPRFPPVGVAEVAGLELEISALTPFARVSGPEAVVVGRDGVLLEKGGRRAVFLPQVAPEQGWGRDEMLDHLCAKAGLPVGCWQHGADLSTFQAEVFAEGESH